MLLDIKKEINKKIPLLKNINKEEIKFLINEEILKASEETYISDTEKANLKEKLVNEIIGFGKIEKLINDDEINEIMINGKDNIFIEKKGIIIKTDIILSSEEIENIMQRIVSQVNKSISFAKPIVDARLKNGSRVNIVNYPLALNGPIITIRKFNNKLLEIEDLIANRTITKEAADFLRIAVNQRYNIFISGGTGSGKTTLLNIISNFIDKEERIITIEDSAELKLKKIKNIVSLEARDNNFDKNNIITIRDLLKTSLRMRPDRIIVGEVRGPEAFDMLQAMNTGHDGSLSTGHSNSAQDMLIRLESMVIMGYDIPLEAIRRQIASALDIIVHVSKNKKGERKIIEISQILGYENGKYIIENIFSYDGKKDELRKVGELCER